MQVSVEISMYPLADDYIPSIQEFILGLRKYEAITVETNVMSTQVFGEYDIVLAAIQQEMKHIYAQGIKASFSIKVLPGNLQQDVNLDF